MSKYNLDNLNSVARFDKGVVGKAVVTDEGFLKADAIVSRTGVFTYLNSDGSIRKELRHPDDVFKNDSLDSLKMRPITNGHPPQKLVRADNAKELTIGYTGENVTLDGEFLITSLLITDSEGVKTVQSGTKRELSLGYTVDLLREDGVYNGEEYTHRQTNIKYNHLAIVDRARAGNEARIHLDSGDATQLIATDNDYVNNVKPKEKKMTEEKFSVVTLDGLEYKSAPEVANAYKKAIKSNDELSVKIDSLNKDIDILKAEKDAIQEKLDSLKEINNDSKIQELVKKRVELINNSRKILGNKSEDINLDDMSDKDIMVTVVREKCPKVKLDEASDIYVQARFDSLVEDFEDKSDSIAKQRTTILPKLDAKEKEMDKEEYARQKMLDRLKNGYKKDKMNKGDK